MTNNILTKYITLKEPSGIFASAIATDYVELNNYRYVDFIVSSGVGTVANTTITMFGKLGESGTATAVTFKEMSQNGIDYENVSVNGKAMSIGGTAGSCGNKVFRASVDDLTKDGYDRVSLKATAVASSQVLGSVIAILYSPRYSE